MNPIFISQLKATIPKQKRAVKNFPPNQRKSPVLWMCSVFYLFSIFFHDPMQETLKNGLAALWAFLFIGLSSSKHFYPIIWIKRQPKDQHLSQVLKNILFNQKIFPNYRLITAWRHKHTKKPPELVSLYLPFPAPYINQEKLCQISSAHIKYRIN